MQRVVGDPGVERKILNLLERTSLACTIDYVSSNLRLSWPSARAALFNLTMEDRISAQKTTKGWIFTAVKKNDSLRRKNGRKQ